jgi:hypothetical protein
MTDLAALKAAALAATPVVTELYGDRYFQDDFSRADLTKEQDDFVSLANPANVLALISEIERLTAENEALRVDAGRYQTIREGRAYIEPGEQDIYVVAVMQSRVAYCKSPSDFDAIIDAIKGQTP